MKKPHPPTVSDGNQISNEACAVSPEGPPPPGVPLVSPPVSLRSFWSHLVPPGPSWFLLDPTGPTWSLLVFPRAQTSRQELYISRSIFTCNSTSEFYCLKVFQMCRIN